MEAGGVRGSRASKQVVSGVLTGCACQPGPRPIVARSHATHTHTHTSHTPPPSPHTHSAWLDTWRRHLQAALSRKPASGGLPPAPPPLPVAVRELLCKCHPDTPMLAVQPPDIVTRRGRWALWLCAVVPAELMFVRW
jgi:hypothetical protein